jgi:hypothetical protein
MGYGLDDIIKTGASLFGGGGGGYGGLVSTGASLLGSYLSDENKQDAITEANRANIQQTNALQKQLLDRSDAGSTDALGGRTGQFIPGQGYTTTLSPIQQALLDRQLGLDTGLQNFASQRLNNTNPITRDRAQGMAQQNLNQVKNALLGPAMQDASTVDARTSAGTTNQGKTMQNFMQRIMPQLAPLASQTAGLDIFNKNQRAFDDNNLSRAMQARTGVKTGIPGATSSGEIANLNNASRVTPTSVTPDLTGSNTGNLIAGVGSAVGANNQALQATSDRDALLAAIAKQRSVGDQNTDAFTVG